MYHTNKHKQSNNLRLFSVIFFAAKNFYPVPPSLCCVWKYGCYTGELDLVYYFEFGFTTVQHTVAICFSYFLLGEKILFRCHK